MRDSDGPIGKGSGCLLAEVGVRIAMPCEAGESHPGPSASFSAMAKPRSFQPPNERKGNHGGRKFRLAGLPRPGSVVFYCELSP